MKKKRSTALWASTSARGGISAFVDTMAESPVWSEWNVRLLATHSNGNMPSRLGKFAKGLYQYLVQLAFDRPVLVHLHISHYGSFFRKAMLAWLAKAFRVPVILHIHGSQFHTFAAEAAKPARWLIQTTLEHADTVLALGDIWAGRLQVIAPKANIAVLPNAVKSMAVKRQASESPVRFAFLGEIGERKGAFVLLDAWARMYADAEEPLSAHLTIAGDGDIDRARRIVAAHKLEATVEILGWIPKHQARELLSASNVLVLPSRNEGQPMAILEAMAQGLCIIASDVGGIPEMLGGSSGILVAHDAVEELASAMAKVVSDPIARAVYGRKAFERFEREYNLDLLSQRLDRIYRDVTVQRRYRGAHQNFG